ncbi:hypothetical protein [Streptosporangium vulgare]|uniref:Uncharacterized protein n=1 Tax=Streptosporangium vulgare TaxID=46190 RepID=A0ABV5TP29_9ACTN
MTRMIPTVPPETARRLLRQSLITLADRREASPVRHTGAGEKREKPDTGGRPSGVFRHDREQASKRAGRRAGTRRSRGQPVGRGNNPLCAAAEPVIMVAMFRNARLVTPAAAGAFERVRDGLER